jgi:hypothetical protein
MYVPGILYGWFQLHKGFGNRALSNITCSLQFVPSVSQQRISVTDTRNKSSADKSSILYLNNAKNIIWLSNLLIMSTPETCLAHTKFDIYVISYIVYLFSLFDLIYVSKIVDHLFKTDWMISQTYSCCWRPFDMYIIYICLTLEQCKQEMLSHGS